MRKEEGRNMVVGGTGYGTFQGYPQPLPPVVGFPQHVPPPFPSVSPPPHLHPSPCPPYVYYAHGYQAIPVAEGRPVAEGLPLSLRTERLPFCGLGIGWFLFIIGFIFGGIPWYVGALVLLFVRIDYREKPGFLACTIAAVLAAIAVTFGFTN